MCTVKRQVLAKVRRCVSSTDYNYMLPSEGTPAVVLASVEGNTTEEVVTGDIWYPRFAKTSCRENYMRRVESDTNTIPVNHHSPSLGIKVVGRDRKEAGVSPYD